MIAIVFSSQDSRKYVIFKSYVVAPIDNDSEDEGTSKTKAGMKGAEQAGEQEEDSGETGIGEADNDEDGAEEEDGEVSQEMEGVDPGSDADSRQTGSASMSSRSESKPYSSVTHKCEVRDISLNTQGKNKLTYYFCVNILLDFMQFLACAGK